MWTLEVVVKFIILLVVASILIGVIFHFANKIKSEVGGEEKPEIKIIEVEKISQAQFNTYVQSCYYTCKPIEKGIITCYVLSGDFSGIDIEKIDKEIKVFAPEFDKSKPVAVIKCDAELDLVIIENPS